MSLLSYDEVRPWARAIQEAVALDRMPPWFADPQYGEWSNAHVLSPGEKQVILDWVESGAVRGDPSRRPAPREFIDGWNIGEPELVLSMPEAFRVPPGGTIEYQYVVLPTGLTEDKWVTAAEVRPDNREVVHHVIAFMRPKESVWLEDAVPGEIFVPGPRKEEDREEGRNEYRELLVGFAPGMQPYAWSDQNYAKLLPAGADIVLQMHYTASGEEALDQSSVGFRFLDKPPAKRVVTMSASNAKFVIPPRAPHHPVAAKRVLSREVELVSLMPHMHLRGKDFRYDVQYPGGRSEVLLSVPQYDFEWQYVYYLKEPRILPAGTTIECLAHFDNSPNNPDNPDPSVEVRWGDQSWEEMMIGFFDIAVDAGADLQAYLGRSDRDTERVE